MILQIQKQKPYFVNRGYRTPPATYRQLGTIFSTQADTCSIQKKYLNEQNIERPIYGIPSSRKKSMVIKLKQMLSSILKKQHEKHEQQIKEQNEINKNFRIENQVKKEQARKQLQQNKKSLYKLYKHHCTTETQPLDWNYFSEKSQTQRKQKNKKIAMEHQISRKNIQFNELKSSGFDNKMAINNQPKKYYLTQTMSSDKNKNQQFKKETLQTKTKSNEKINNIDKLKKSTRQKNFSEQKNINKTIVKQTKKGMTKFKNKQTQVQADITKFHENDQNSKQQFNIQEFHKEDCEKKFYQKIKRGNCRKGSSKLKLNSNQLEETLPNFNLYDRLLTDDPINQNNQQNNITNIKTARASRTSSRKSKLSISNFGKKHIFTHSNQMKNSKIFRGKEYHLQQQQCNNNTKKVSNRFYMSRYAKQKLFFSINNNDFLKKIKPSKNFSNDFSLNEDMEPNEIDQQKFQRQYLEKIMNRLQERSGTPVLSENFNQFFENILIDEDEQQQISIVPKRTGSQVLKKIAENTNKKLSIDKNKLNFKNSLRKIKQLINYDEFDNENNEEFSYNFFTDMENYLLKKSLIKYPLKTIKHHLCKFLKENSLKQNSLFKNYAFYMYLQSNLLSLHKKLEKIEGCEEQHLQQNQQIISLVNQLDIGDSDTYKFDYDPHETEYLMQLPIKHYKNDNFAQQISTWVNWDIQDKNQSNQLKQIGFNTYLLNQSVKKG